MLVPVRLRTLILHGSAMSITVVSVLREVILLTSYCMLVEKKERSSGLGTQTLVGWFRERRKVRYVGEWNISHAYRVITGDKSILINP